MSFSKGAVTRGEAAYLHQQVHRFDTDTALLSALQSH